MEKMFFWRLKMARKLKFRIKCPDCKKRKYLITHHFITRDMMRYLIEVAGFERGDIITLRNQLTVDICKDCEKKFHNGEFYNKEGGKNGNC